MPVDVDVDNQEAQSAAGPATRHIRLARPGEASSAGRIELQEQIATADAHKRRIRRALEIGDQFADRLG